MIWLRVCLIIQDIIISDISCLLFFIRIYITITTYAHSHARTEMSRQQPRRQSPPQSPPVLSDKELIAKLQLALADALD